jgi:hypothetical protein
MDTRVLQQGLDKYAVWSTEDKEFLSRNLTREEVIEWYEQQEGSTEIDEVKELLNKYEAGNNPYDEGINSFEEALSVHINAQAREGELDPSDLTREGGGSSSSKRIFPTWVNPGTVATLVIARTILNLALTAVIAVGAGPRTWFTVVAAGLTIGSTVVMVQTIRPGPLGDRASSIELLGQLALLALASYVTYLNFSVMLLAAFLVVAIVALVFWWGAVVTYGEAFHAP